MSRRTEKVDELLRQEISSILLRDFEAPQGALVTVSGAEVSPDLKRAIIYVSVLPENLAGSTMEVLRKNAGHIQRLLNRKLHMKFVPRIEWSFDETNLKLSAIDEAMNDTNPID